MIRNQTQSQIKFNLKFWSTSFSLIDAAYCRLIQIIQIELDYEARNVRSKGGHGARIGGPNGDHGRRIDGSNSGFEAGNGRYEL